MVAGVTTAVLITGAAGFSVWRAHAGPASTAAARPAGGPAPRATASGTTVTVTWDQAEVLPTVPAEAYEVTRYDAKGVPSPGRDGCTGRVSRLFCVEAGLSDGDYRYTVRPYRGGWTGDESQRSVPVRVSTLSIAFPAAAGLYGTASYAAGCDDASDLCGTVLARNGIDITGVRYSVRSGDLYWDPVLRAFLARDEHLMDATIVRPPPPPATPKPQATTPRLAPRKPRPAPTRRTAPVRPRRTTAPALPGGSIFDGAAHRTGWISGLHWLQPVVRLVSHLVRGPLGVLASLPRRLPAVPGPVTPSATGTAAPAPAAPAPGAGGTPAPSATPRPSPPPQPVQEPMLALPWRAGFPVGNFPRDGQYTVRVVSTDAQGRGGSATVTFRVLPTPPGAPVLTKRPAAVTNMAGATFGFRSARPGADVSFGCAVDNGPFSPCRSEFTARGLPTGQHTFRVHAVDRGGNAGPEATHTWMVDSTPPTALDVQTEHGTDLAGRLGMDDVIRLIYSKEIVPDSVVPGWDGNGTVEMTVRAVPGVAGGPDTLFFYDKADRVQLHGIGTVTLGAAEYVTGTETVPIPAWLTMVGNSLVIRLGVPEGGWRLATVTVPATMTWQPGDAHDRAGNAMTAPPGGAVEQGPPDVDF